MKSSVNYLSICVASFCSLQTVRVHGSEFLFRYAHSHVKFILINLKFSMGSGINMFSALICAYAMGHRSPITHQGWHMMTPLTLTPMDTLKTPSNLTCKLGVRQEG